MFNSLFNMSRSNNEIKRVGALYLHYGDYAMIQRSFVQTSLCLLCFLGKFFFSWKLFGLAVSNQLKVYEKTLSELWAACNWTPRSVFNAIVAALRLRKIKLQCKAFKIWNLYELICIKMLFFSKDIE